MTEHVVGFADWHLDQSLEAVARPDAPAECLAHQQDHHDDDECMGVKFPRTIMVLGWSGLTDALRPMVSLDL